MPDGRGYAHAVPESNNVRQPHQASGRAAASYAAAGISAESIAAAALRLLRNGGLDRLTMRSVAAELGVRAPSLYHHVQSKGQLLDLVARSAFEAFTAPTEYDAVDSVDAFIALVRANSLAVLDFYRAHPGLAGAVLRAGDPTRDAAASARHAERDALVRLGVAPGTATSLLDAAARWTVAAAAADGSPLSSRAREDRIFTDGLDLLLAGLRTAVTDAALRTGESSPGAPLA